MGFTTAILFTVFESLITSVPAIINELACSKSLFAVAREAPPTLSPSVKSAVVNANLFFSTLTFVIL